MGKRFSITPRKPPAAVDAFVAAGEATVDRVPEAVHGVPDTVDGGPSTVDAMPSVNVEPVRARPSNGATVHRIPVTGDRREAPVPWEDSHRRVTFHCPNAVLAEVEAAMKKSGRSKSRLIVDAIRAHLAVGQG
jgi:hypothetical protein